MKNHYFWTWFLENEQDFRMLRLLSPEKQKNATHWLQWHLHFYSPGIDYILIYHNKAGTSVEMIITANGDPDYFDQVEKLVQDAPAVPYWKVTAFVQPAFEYEDLENGLDKPYIFQDLQLKASELSFLPLESSDGDKIDLVIYLRRFTLYARNKNLLQLIFIIMQDVLGEKKLFGHINFVQLAQMPENEKDVLRLYDLQFYLDMFGAGPKS